MSAYLEAVALARELRDHAERAFRESLVRAREDGHTFEAIGRAAGLTRAGVHHLCRITQKEGK